MNKVTYNERNVIDLSSLRYLPRWSVLIIDIFLAVVSLFVSFYLLNGLDVKNSDNLPLYQKYILIIGINIIFMLIFRTYSGIIRHSTFADLFKILLSNVSTIFILWLINVANIIAVGEVLLPNIPLILYFTISFVLMSFFRLFVKEIFQQLKEFRRSALKKRILILGIDEESISMAKAIMGNPKLPYDVAGFLTQRTDSNHAVLLGKAIYSKDKLMKYRKEYLGLHGILINKNNFSKEELNQWVNFFLERGLVILKTPSLQKLRPDENIKIHQVQIEDLLNRKPIVIQNDEVKKRHFQKNVLVTGGAGSIGSEIVRQVASFNPSLVVVLDQAETPLYDIELEMKEKFPNTKFKFVLADISNKERIESVFMEHDFSMVYHAAAYKHVPLIEENPHEAILVNIQGSKNLALLSSKYKINRFVMVSTDKAVNPTNVMGASKRTAELFVQALQNEEGNATKFITTRFGNVLGSNGSVIPHFRKQIEKGGPVTITHPDIVRYFMTIPEACELVLQAGTMGKGGEIFVFDMGEPVKILNLATRMIKLSGYEPNVDIKIVYTGLRPGEKLYEELLSDDTRTLPTHHEKIMVSKDPTMAFKEIDALSNKISAAAKLGDKIEVVRILKEIVKEFKSNNSIFEILDRNQEQIKEHS
ncbi:polysaccharide biosynthesis protein [Capnocytophaga cynodegmi]|uniref:Putative UDP-GlcNAc-4,6-dehydratase n=1 Tax=Capnocytophaga cynodegmi TaxID=28189 RepID=A0A0B7HDE1_9FLAO|nr:nucleoside-diphosphate sugar epimerase/dehydratase [Capnocytophaga cynodegmi]CEN35932.1 putative UDP-GlcNAc-4,6-dehydratase [Capnocytophaga cynodegmi]CEN36568.1 putative UDP-GlcNAc-4,6-dehydratase [Capnocytophaga cynodegmi]